MNADDFIGGHDILALERFLDETRHMIIFDSAPKSAAIRQDRRGRKRNGKPSVANTVIARGNALSAASCSGQTAAVRPFAPRNAARNIIMSTVLNGGITNKPRKS